MYLFFFLSMLGLRPTNDKCFGQCEACGKSVLS